VTREDKLFATVEVEIVFLDDSERNRNRSKILQNGQLLCRGSQAINPFNFPLSAAIGEMTPMTLKSG
jgi:hypothetical protein